MAHLATTHSPKLCDPPGPQQAIGCPLRIPLKGVDGGACETASYVQRMMMAATI